jgi:hypothetical protein
MFPAVVVIPSVTHLPNEWLGSWEPALYWLAGRAVGFQTSGSWLRPDVNSTGTMPARTAARSLVGPRDAADRPDQRSIGVSGWLAAN